jgi:hypothetical protein
LFVGGNGGVEVENPKSRNPKSQINLKFRNHEIPKSEASPRPAAGRRRSLRKRASVIFLRFGHLRFWNFFGIWDFGIWDLFLRQIV